MGPFPPGFHGAGGRRVSTVSVVAAAENREHTRCSVGFAVRSILESLGPLSDVIKTGERVLVKVNMGCSGARGPEHRLTTHPLMAETIIGMLLDYGAQVCFGDDVSRTGRHSDEIYRATGMEDVARRTGARLVDFIATGAREIRSRLLYPRSHLITNRYFDADKVINVASCRSHVGVGLSGAIKNMFGCVVGLRKGALHNLFAGDPRRFGRALADIYRAIPPDLSFLDLTSVAECAGTTLAVRPVGLILGGRDGVALDTVASYAIGYEELPIWPTYYAARFGVGCNRMEQIQIRGLDWNSVPKPRLGYPAGSAVKASAYDRLSRVVNNTVLRPRPVITDAKCTKCGDCVERCPVACIEHAEGAPYQIDLPRCVDCGCCVSICKAGAIKVETVGWCRPICKLIDRLPRFGNEHHPPADPAGKW